MRDGDALSLNTILLGNTKLLLKSVKEGYFVLLNNLVGFDEV
jgi:hypothetical protein